MLGRGKFTISKNQFNGLLQGDTETFIFSLTRYVIDTFPDEVRGIPAHLIYAMVQTGVNRAKRHGLITDEQLYGFVSVMFEIAPNFDEEPTLKAVLTDRGRKPAERWRTLFKDNPALNAAWERAAHPDFYNSDAWVDN